MIPFNISLFVVVSFLLLTLVVGIYFSRKKTTFQEYATGNKQFSTATLVATVLATNYGGSGLLRVVESIYDAGLWWIVYMILASFTYWIISRLAIRMGPFMHHLSMAETIGIYGRYPRMVTALICVCGSIIVITSQITAMSQAIHMCLRSINPVIVTILSTLLLIFYSTFGGVRAVTFTDVLQFITFSIIIPILAWFMFVQAGKPVSEVVSLLQSQPKFQFSNLFQFNTQLMNLVLLLLSCLISVINPQVVQRVYMASDPIQARKVYAYATVFSFLIISCIILVSLFVFAGASDLSTAAVWAYIGVHIPPLFKGFLAIALFAMAMSTADSCLNVCSVMISHDVVIMIQKEKSIPDVRQLKIARWTTLAVGLSAMLIAFQCNDLLKLMYWSIYCSVPMTIPPFILVVFGFRGTSRTALIGMAIGLLTILAWNKWIKPATGVDGSLFAAVANGLSMIAAHYLFKQPEGAGWVGPDDTFKQIQQANARKHAERKEAIKNTLNNRKITLSKLVPSRSIMVCIGIYTTLTNFLSYFIVRIINHGSSLIFQLFISAFFLGYPFLHDAFKKIRSIPKWCIGLIWFLWLAVYFPKNLIWNWWNMVDPVFTTFLFLTHCTVILWVLPMYIGVGIVVATIVLSIYPITTVWSFTLLSSLLPLFIVSLLLMFAVMICFKMKIGNITTQNIYLKNQENIRKSQQLKACLYDTAMVPSNGTTPPKGYGAILNQVVGKIEESISFLDDKTLLYKQDLQSIINKFYDWIAYFNRREKSKDHALLQPTKITFDKLIHKVEVALSQEVIDPPRILLEKTNDAHKILSIICDINQIVYLLVQSVLRVGKIENDIPPVVRIQLHPTTLHFIQADPIDNSHPTFMNFKATALVISHSTVDAKTLPKVKKQYNNLMDYMGPKGKQEVPPSIDLQQQTISTIIEAHYGYLEAPDDASKKAMLLVLPNRITDILSKMATTLPIDALTSNAPVTPKEQADSIMLLMQFHDYVSKVSIQEDPIDLKTISGLLLLLRKHFGFKRHNSGQLLYVRAVGIAELVVEWVFHSPKVVYASLLYELVRHTCLPISYIKKHYNLGVYTFVLNLVNIDKRQDLDHASLLYVKNRLKEAIKKDHVQLSVLFIKLAERLYDLRHAAGYIYLTEVQHMAQETLAIDVEIANKYLGTEIGIALEKAAKKALAFCEKTNKAKGKEG
ncbi:sodium:solute symporter family transporter [Cardinium endosymbiont of Nabis limbatus]|uniref:sodium:solute symporter family transporter n=1 Tax=Cardinium endosymbiont of Nabis limbatus TaxID=3066217 RepID=UPI003AF37F0C